MRRAIYAEQDAEDGAAAGESARAVQGRARRPWHPDNTTGLVTGVASPSPRRAASPARTHAADVAGLSTQQRAVAFGRAETRPRSPAWYAVAPTRRVCVADALRCVPVAWRCVCVVDLRLASPRRG